MYIASIECPICESSAYQKKYIIVCKRNNVCECIYNIHMDICECIHVLLVGHCSNLNLFGKLMKEQTQMDWKSS